MKGISSRVWLRSENPDQQKVIFFVPRFFFGKFLYKDSAFAPRFGTYSRASFEILADVNLNRLKCS
jgi:hypothetical protein